MNLNKVLLIGKLTRDIELRYLANGTAVAKMGLAVNRKFKNRDGEMQEEVCFVDIDIWGKQAETCNQYLKKGSGAFIEGRLKFDSWQAQDGSKRNKLSVTADRVQFMPRGGGGGGEFGGASRIAQQDGGTSDFGGNYNQPTPSEAGSLGGGYGSPEGSPGPDSDSSGGAYHDDNVPF